MITVPPYHATIYCHLREGSDGTTLVLHAGRC